MPPKMSVFLKDIMEDASEHKWEHVRGFHVFVLNMMDTDHLSWSDKKQVHSL